MDNLTLPIHFKYIIPIVEVLKDLGGSGKPTEVIDLIVEKLGISEHKLLQINKRGKPKIRTQIHWPRFFLSKTGYLSSTKWGVWQLTEKGQKADFSSENLINIHRQNKEWWYAWFKPSA
jgi:restriction system protein